jgi:hypothetical protein
MSTFLSFGLGSAFQGSRTLNLKLHIDGGTTRRIHNRHLVHGHRIHWEFIGSKQDLAAARLFSIKQLIDNELVVETSI